MGPDVVVVVSPERQLSSGIAWAVKHLLIQALIALTTVQRTDDGILLRLARIDVLFLDHPYDLRLGKTALPHPFAPSKGCANSASARGDVSGAGHSILLPSIAAKGSRHQSGGLNS
jgi:hypothetical protein